MIRRARPDDAGAIAGIHHRTWHAAYAEILDPTELPEVPEPERWAERLQHAAITTLVWDQGGAVAGFASAGQGTLLALYVDPRAQGAGVGTALMEAALDLLRADGNRDAVAWTFVDNERARRFYEKHGWTAEPETTDRHERVDALEIRYRRPL